MARCVWALADEEITEHLYCSDEGRAREWLAMLISTLHHDDQIKVFVTLWAIWHARRKAIHEQIYQSPLTVHHFAARFVEELRESEGLPRSKPRVAAEQRDLIWIPPPRGTTKINVDAAVGKNTGRGSVAAVAQDDTRLYLGASVVVFPR
jgi:hypothetical protein